MITVELFEVARQRAGVAHVTVQAATLREALTAVCTAHPELAPDVIQDGVLATHWRAGLDGHAWLADPDHPLSDGDHVILVSALAGG